MMEIEIKARLAAFEEIFEDLPPGLDYCEELGLRIYELRKILGIKQEVK